MNTPLIKSRKRTYENDSPRQQRTYEQKKEIIDFYNSIKSEFGSKSKTVNKFDLKYVFFIKSITKPGTLDAIKAMEVMRNYLKLENPNLLCDFLRLEKEINNSISFDKKTQTKIIDYMYRVKYPKPEHSLKWNTL
jgi:hypothetical protein